MHRRMDPDLSRRESRERDVSHTAGNSSRFSRKRPSMLSEFHGSKYHNHSVREGDRDGDIQHYRSHNRYLHDPSSGNLVSSSDHVHSFTSSGFHSKLSKCDSRSRHSHHHNQHRSASHHHHSNSYHHSNSSSDVVNEEDVTVKRPRLMVDVTWKALGHVENPNSMDLLSSGSGGDCGGLGAIDLPVVSPPLVSGGLSAYLEDIVSDDDDSFLRDEDDNKVPLSKSPTPVPTISPQPCPAPPGDGEGGGSVFRCRKMMAISPMKSGMPSKEELLIMMDKVDRDIAAVEMQISALQKKQAELEETAKTMASTPHSGMSISSSLPSPSQPSSSKADVKDGTGGDDTEMIISPLPSSPRKTQLDAIYSDNKCKARSAHAILTSLNFPPLPGLTTLYHQPCDAPSYHTNLDSHQAFRANLVQCVRQRKLGKHQKELALCEEYDWQMNRWEKSVERIETNPKKRIRDQKNRELFERCFPELKARREPQERFTRVDQRGYGTVRSDAELKEILYELSEQEEAPVRHRRTHAAIPPMLIEERDKRLQYDNKNGLIADPMALHRESCFVYMWSAEEKRTFRDKYMFNPKNFGVISSFLPNKTPMDCVLYYYLSKKREKFKQLVRKANFKRKKPFVKTGDFSASLAPSSRHHHMALSVFPSTKTKAEMFVMSPKQESETSAVQSEYDDWSTEEISSVKEGLRKYGRAWGKIYREVGGRKTATQCKQFYDKYCTDKQLELSVALAEHSSMKNAEKLRRKADRCKSASAVVVEEKKVQKSHHKLLPPQRGGAVETEVDSENTESAYETESKTDESGSESTITDSCPEESSSTVPLSSSIQLKPLRGGKKSKPLFTGGGSGPGFKRSSEEALDLFISAAEALNNIVPPEVALHDHSYSLAPNSLVNSMELQGTSGLSLIAAAAAVVSPTLARSTGGNKLLSLSPIRAPRGRPPNSQRKGTSSTTSKLAPTLLSPTGSCNSVLLTVKTGPPRVRTRSAPSDRPKLSTLHVPRPSSTLARMSINSSNRPVVVRGNSAATLVSPASSTVSHNNSNSSGPSSSSTSAFEALVDVAVAAPPAELNQSSISGSFHLLPSSSSHSPASLKLSSSYSVPPSSSSSSSSLSFTATTLPSSQPTVTLAVTGSNSNASNSSGTTTAYLDVNQAINFLASLAQQQVASGTSNGNSQSISLLPTQRLLAPVNLLGNIVTQGQKANSSSGGGLMASSLSSSKGSKGLHVSAWSDTLLGHLTSGISSQTTSGKTMQSKGASGKTKKAVSSKSEVSFGKINSSSGSTTSKEQGGRMVCNVSSSGLSVVSTMGSNANASIGTSIVKTGDDLSNLNLLSSLVAAVAASSQATAAISSSLPLSTTTSDPKVSMGQSSNLYGSKTELKRMCDSGAASTKGVATSSASVWSSDRELATSTSSLSNSSPLTSTPTSDESSMASSSCAMKQQQPLVLKMEIDKSTCIQGPLSYASKSSLYSTASSSSGLVGSGAVDGLPRSVVRSVLGSAGINKEDHPSSVEKPRTISNNTNISASSSSFVTENDMTASLASIIPSMSTQSSLLLYTRSLSFPMSMSAEPSTEEEDHLASATRGISELSKLLGTDNNSDSAGSRTRQDSLVYKDVSSIGWNPSDLLNTALSGNGVVNSSEKFVSSLPEKSGAYLSSMLESKIHGTVHHTSLTAASKLNSSSTNSNMKDNRESTLDVDHRSSPS